MEKDLLFRKTPYNMHGIASEQFVCVHFRNVYVVHFDALLLYSLQ